MRHDQANSQAVSDTGFAEHIQNLLRSNPDPVKSSQTLRDTIYNASIAMVTSESGFEEQDISNLREMYIFLQAVEKQFSEKVNIYE